MNFKRISVLLSAAVFLASCGKEPVTGVEEGNYTGPKMVNFNNYEGYQKVNVDLGSNWVPFDFTVKLTNTTKTAEAPITVNLIKDDNPIFEYNTANGTNLTPIPSTAYRFDTTTVVIPAGARTARVHFEVRPGSLNLSSTYAFGLSIATVSGDGATVSTNTEENSLVVELGTLNSYDGLYNKRSFFSHPTSLNLGGIYGAAAPYEVALVTSGAASVDSYIDGYAYPTEVVVDWSGPQYTYFTGVNPRFTINAANNAVTVSASPITAAGTGQAVIAQTAADAAVSRYYPTGITGFSTTKTIVAHFRWSVPNDRIARDTFVYTGPR